MATTPAFVREATGLVRAFSYVDAFILSIAASGASIYTIAEQVAFVATADPGADIVNATILGFIFFIPLAITYFILARSMPRSGGDYVWVSRYLNPALGFMAGWGFWIGVLSGVGLLSYVQGAVMYPVTLASFGYALNIPSLVSAALAMSAPTNIFLQGIVMLAFVTAVTCFGAKFFARTIFAMFALVMLSTLIAVVVLVSASHADFVNAFNNFGGTNVTYNGIISQAQSAGWSYVPLQWNITVASIPIAMLVYVGFNFASAVAGEVKNVSKSMIAGVVIALLFTAIVDVAGIWFSVNLLGYQFIQASNALGSSWPLAAPPWVPLFVSMLNRNVVVLVLFHLGWLLAQPWGCVAFLAVATRYVFAFSFDRAFPTRFADVNAKFNVPLKATALNFVVAAIFLALATFTSYIGLFVNLLALEAVVWLFASVVAIILPFKKRELVKSVPGIDWKIPSLSIMGFVSLILMLLTEYFAVTTPAIGPSTLSANAVLVAIFVVGLLVYAARFGYCKSKGIDLKLIYSQLPPE